MLPLIAFFLVFSILPGLYNWHVWRVARTRRELRSRGRRAVGRILGVRGTTGAMAVSSTTIDYEFEAPDADGKPHPFRRSEMLTSGLTRPRAGSPVDVVYLEENPKRAAIAGNDGNYRTLLAPLVLVNLLWLSLLVAIFVEGFNRV